MANDIDLILEQAERLSRTARDLARSRAGATGRDDYEQMQALRASPYASRIPSATPTVQELREAQELVLSAQREEPQYPEIETIPLPTVDTILDDVRRISDTPGALLIDARRWLDRQAGVEEGMGRGRGPFSATRAVWRENSEFRPYYELASNVTENELLRQGLALTAELTEPGPDAQLGSQIRRGVTAGLGALGAMVGPLWKWNRDTPFAEAAEQVIARTNNDPSVIDDLNTAFIDWVRSRVVPRTTRGPQTIEEANKRERVRQNAWRSLINGLEAYGVDPNIRQMLNVEGNFMTEIGLPEVRRTMSRDVYEQWMTPQDFTAITAYTGTTEVPGITYKSAFGYDLDLEFGGGTINYWLRSGGDIPDGKMDDVNLVTDVPRYEVLNALQNEVATQIAQLDRLFSNPNARLPEPVTTWRGTAAKSAFLPLPNGMTIDDLEGLPDDTVIQNMIGQTITDPGLWSTSENIDTAFDFLNSSTVKLEPDDFQVLYRIDLPERAPGLALGRNVSQYPNEQEILLPRGMTYRITGAEKIDRMEGDLLVLRVEPDLDSWNPKGPDADFEYSWADEPPAQPINPDDDFMQDPAEQFEPTEADLTDEELMEGLAMLAEDQSAGQYELFDDWGDAYTEDNPDPLGFWEDN